MPRLMAVVFLLLGALTALGAFFALVAPRRPAALAMATFFLGLVPSELPFATLVTSAVLVIVFVTADVLDSVVGVIGLVLFAAAAAIAIVLAARSASTGVVIERALAEGLGPGHAGAVDPQAADRLRRGVPLLPVLLTPFRARRRDVERIADIPYGDAGVRNMLDLYRSRTPPTDAPILLSLHGGAWISGKKDRQGLPLVYHLASRGWLCVAPNYRLSPAATFPDQLVDVKRALAWVRVNCRRYGGDPDAVFVSGGSAGGHLSALLALTPNDPAFQPGFEEVDTSVAAAIPLYGDYDFLDSSGERAALGLDRTEFFAQRILKCSGEENRRAWEQASPLHHVRPDAPPFFVMHGDRDSLLLVEDARHFVKALRAASRAPVVYAELPGAHHMFDTFQSVRCGHAINGIERFAAWVRSKAPAPPFLRPDESGQ
jgi:acetyl esterase/lipase